MSSISTTFKPAILTCFRRPSGLLTGKHGGFHGTTIQNLGDGQLAKRLFEKRGLPIYFDSFRTASDYAIRKKWTDVGGGWSGFGGFQWVSSGKEVRPVILAVSSNTAPKMNDLVANPDLHKHHYFPDGATVQIDALWELDPNITPDEYSEICTEELRNLNLGGAATKVVNLMGRFSNMRVRY